jgi:hypothetical protein
VKRLALCLLIVGCTEPPLELPPPRSARHAVERSDHGRARGTQPARAFTIERAADLLTGVEADGKKGDLRIDNGLCAFVIDSVDSALGFADSGGNLIDAAPPGRADALKQLFGYLDDTFPRQPIFEHVEAGRRGETAWVRARGHDSQNRGLTVETEYALAPGVRALEITTTVINTGREAVHAYEIGDAVQWGRAERFAPGQPPVLHGAVSLPGGWMAAIGDEVAYAYVVDPSVGDGALNGRHGSAWSDLNVATVELAPGAAASVTRWLVVAPLEGATLGDEVAALRKQRWARLEGHIVEEGSGAAIAGARVLLDDKSGRALAFGQSTAGGYAVTAPPGDYQVRVEAPGRAGPERLEQSLRPAATTALDLLLSRPGRLVFEVHEGGTPTPAKLTFLGAGNTRTPRLGPAFAAPGGNLTLTVDGRGEVQVPPGRYRVIASRGPAFTLDDQEVEIQPGEATRARFELQRAVDTRGLLCADLHQHAAGSADSAVAPLDRAAANLAEGLDAIVITEHNLVADFSSVLERLGATRPIGLLAGDEATLDGLGHWNAYPLVPHADRPRGGALDVRNKSAHEIVGGLRAADGGAERVVQVNHPRAGLIGYFNTVGFDPRAPQLPPDWEGGFDAIEVFSSKDVTKADAPMRDWFALLDRGLGYTAVGGSDSHLIYGQEVGYPRTCVPAADGARPADALVAGIKRRHDALVTNGPFVRASVGGHGPGQLAAAARGRARLDVEVQAAPWVDVRRLEVFVDGQRRGKPVDIPAARVVDRWKGAIDLKVERDAYVVVVVRGDASLEPVVSRPEGSPAPLPLAITNPIFLDRDGDGKYTAPLAPKPAPKGR